MKSALNPTAKLKKIVLWFATLGTAATLAGLFWRQDLWLVAGSWVAVVVVTPIIFDALRQAFIHSPLGRHAHVTVAVVLALIQMLVWGRLTKLDDSFWTWFSTLDWEKGVPGAIGATGQLIIAVIAVWVAGKQNEITEKLTGQQNLITQQQTIDAYFQGVSELILDPQGQLEDWPLERAIAQARTAALFGSVDADGCAKILRFLSSANLLTPLKRDGLLGRAILDGVGGYVVDLEDGVRVVSLGTMLVGKNLSHTDLRFCDLSASNFLSVNFSYCNLTGADLRGAILAKANLTGADLNRVALFYGALETASPRDRQQQANYQTGAFCGAVVEEADFSKVEDLSPENQYYICAWGGASTRRTVPGGCKNIPNLLGR
ncbi:MAG: pentapeptide repeat-containing protein [Pseudanabaenaceae cyanobacterium bins.68]|nr:pentapeptide repeat-containing protein [Pseudanabaenaceae cyanobacterium bins.68]